MQPRGKEELYTKFQKSSKFINILTILGCFIAACSLWFYVSGDQNYTRTFYNLPVAVRDVNSITELGLEPISKSEATVDVTISGKRRVISGVTSDDIHPYISLKGITTGQQYLLPIKTEVPKSVNVTSTSLESVNIYIDRIKLETFPVTAEIISGGIKGSSVSEVVIELDTNEITVEGPSEIISIIDKATVKYALGGVIESSVDALGEVVLLDRNGNATQSEYLTITPAVISAHIPVYTSKTVKVVPDFSAGDSTSNYEVTPSTVTIKSEDAIALSKVDEIKTIPINLDSYDEKSPQCGLVLPKGILLASGNDKVEVKINTQSEKTLEITNICCINGSLEVENISSSRKIKFVGRTKDITALTTEDVCIVADLKEYNKPGTYAVPITVISLSGKNVSPDGDYTIKITLKEKTDNKSTPKS